MRAVATGLLLCVAVLALGACTAMAPAPVRAIVAPVAQPAGAEARPAVAGLARGAVVREGAGGYERTTVPPGFLVLMLGVPLIILLL